MSEYILAAHSDDPPVAMRKRKLESKSSCSTSVPTELPTVRETPSAPNMADWGVKRLRSSGKTKELTTHLQKLPSGAHVGINVSWQLVQRHYYIQNMLKKVVHQQDSPRKNLEKRLLEKEANRVFDLMQQQASNRWAERPTEPAWCPVGNNPHKLAERLTHSLVCRPQHALKFSWTFADEKVTNPAKSALKGLLDTYVDPARVNFILNAFTCDRRLSTETVLNWVHRLSISGLLFPNNAGVSFVFLDCLFEACHRLNWSESEQAEATINTALDWLDGTVIKESDIGNISMLFRACTDRTYGDDVLAQSIEWLDNRLQIDHCPSVDSFREYLQGIARQELPHKFLSKTAKPMVHLRAEQMMPLAEDDAKCMHQGCDYYTRNDVRTGMCLLKPGVYKLRNFRTILAVALPNKHCVLSLTKLGYTTKRDLIKGMFSDEITDGRLELAVEHGSNVFIKKSGLGASGNATPPIFVRPPPPALSPPPRPTTPEELMLFSPVEDYSREATDKTNPDDAC